MLVMLQAERAYKQGLLMYPKQPGLLRSYAQFMQDIKLNPTASMRYYSEADKMDAQLSEVISSAGSCVFTLPRVAEYSNCVCTEPALLRGACLIDLSSSHFLFTCCRAARSQ